MENIRLVVADDHLILLNGLKAMLQKQKEMEVVGLYDNGQSLFDELTQTRPHIVLADVNMPRLDGYELTQKIKQSYPSVHVIVLSMHDDAMHIMQMIEAGVSGYLLKNINDKELLDAIRAVAAGKLYFSSEVSEKITTMVIQQQRKLGQPEETPRLTAREIEILKLIAEEYSNAEIADALYISERTVETHRKNMLRKTSNKSIIGLLRYAIQLELI